MFQLDGKPCLVAKIIGTETTRVLGASRKGSRDDERDPLIEESAEETAKAIERQAGY